MTFSQLSFFFLLLIVFMAAISSAVVSIVLLYENERQAAIRSFIFFLFIILLISLLNFLPEWIVIAVALPVFLLLLIVGVLFFAPIGNSPNAIEKPDNQIDERDIMFARSHIIPGSPEFESYYAMRPQNYKSDASMRKLPGLLSLQAKLANSTAFYAAEASFDFIELFRPQVERNPGKKHITVAPGQRTRQIKQLTKHYGAHSVGITELQPYHVYSHIGRGSGGYGEPVHLNHHYAIAFTVEMDHKMIRTAPDAPVVMESSKQYVEAARIAMQLMLFIDKLGYSVRAHIDGNYRVVAPLVARDAALGEIGRMGLLMTPDIGPRVRIGVVTTDMPLTPDIYEPMPSMIDFCRNCKKCAENCPSRAIPFDDRKMINGGLRWQINSETCFHYWCKVGTDCARCISVCPYSHPDNFLHRTVRKGIRRSGFARRVALYADDALYGRKPEQFSSPNWLNEKDE